MNEVGIDIVKTEEVTEKKLKYLNINVSNSEVERKPDIVRLCADAGNLEYVKPSGDAISRQAVQDYIAKYLSQYLYNDVREAVEVIDEYIADLPSVNPQEPKTEKDIKMRDATPEERESVEKYIKSISKPTGVNFWDLEQEQRQGIGMT